MTGFAAKVIRWQRAHGRHDLPWQGTRDPYRIWVSEVMLQQTQVNAVIGYYARFLGRFPDVRVLATADVDEVMRHWSGLGYYSRARNLHHAAGIIVDVYQGEFPRTPAALAELPGIGRSTAAAIACFAFGAPAAILDGNVKRVFARCFGVEAYPGLPKVEADLWRRAQALLPDGRIEAYTQGLMDLGATLCTRTRPRCEACPLRSDCVARREGRTAALPHPRPRKVLPRRKCVMIVAIDGAAVLVEKRPPAGIWGGLWCLPQADDEAGAARLAGRLGARWQSRGRLAVIEHGFTHYHLSIQPYAVRVARDRNTVDEPGRLWLPLAEAAGAALPAPVKKLLIWLAAIPVVPGIGG